MPGCRPTSTSPRCCSERNRTGEALVAAERAVAVANAEVEGYRGIEMLAKAATCLGRCGRDTSEMLARARTLAVSAAGEEKPVRIQALAAVIDGYAALDRPEAVADVVKQMMQMIEAADPDDSRLMIVGASRALQAIGAVEPLRALVGLAVTHVRDGLGGYQLESVAVALAACGDFETAVSAARQIPEAYATIEVFSEIAALLAREDRRDEAVQLFREALALFERDLETTDGSGWHYSEHLLSAAQVLGAAASLEPMIRNGAPKDAVWHSWLLAGLARVLNRTGRRRGTRSGRSPGSRSPCYARR